MNAPQPSQTGREAFGQAIVFGIVVTAFGVFTVRGIGRVVVVAIVAVIVVARRTATRGAAVGTIVFLGGSLRENSIDGNSKIARDGHTPKDHVHNERNQDQKVQDIHGGIGRRWQQEHLTGIAQQQDKIANHEEHPPHNTGEKGVTDGLETGLAELPTTTARDAVGVVVGDAVGGGRAGLLLLGRLVETVVAVAAGVHVAVAAVEIGTVPSAGARVGTRQNGTARHRCALLLGWLLWLRGGRLCRIPKKWQTLLLFSSVAVVVVVWASPQSRQSFNGQKL